MIEDGAATHLGNGLRGYFVTLTAPGTNEHRRWRQGKHRGARPECGCHDHGMTRGEWNAQESACWNRVRTNLARDRTVIFAGSVETQKRGLLHRHVVLFTDQPLTFEDAQDYALRAGYGCVLDVERVESVGKAARYLAKYVTKSSAERSVVPWDREVVDKSTGELTRQTAATFRLWSSSRAWGVTIKQLKAAALAQARARAAYLAQWDALVAEAAAAGPEVPTSGSPDPP